MSEYLDIFTKDGKKIGKMPKKEYYTTEFEDRPWIKCCTCFVVDAKTGNVLLEKRGKTELDPGQYDLCSGHVKSNELPQCAMVRELGEELNIPDYVASNVKHLSDVNIDYTALVDEDKRKELKTIVSIFALIVQDISQIKKGDIDVARIGWIPSIKAVDLIRNGKTRVPYDESMSSQFEEVFSKLDEFISPKKKDSEKIYQ